MSFLQPVRLAGERVTLEPLSHDQHDGLVDAVLDGRLWELWYTSVPSPDAMRAEIDRRLAEQRAGTMLPFAARRNDTGALIGMTTYLHADPEHRRLEIGATWTARSAQRTGLNAESKLLLLTHAFDALGCVAVEFRTHWHNLQSRAAIERLGARQDGVLRHHQRLPDGSLRDTVVFSITAPEWPAVRNGLRHRLARRSPDPAA
jgi:RimJ/RimL family protein N-acetyltransferase